MRARAWSLLAVSVWLSAAVDADAQTTVGALAIDERRGDQYGWAVDYETAAAARSRALSECGAGCSVVLTFQRCAAYAADQDSDSTAVGWAESYGSASAAQQAALSACGSRGTGYLDGPSVAALRSSGPGQTTFRQRPASAAAPGPAASAQPASPPMGNAGLEALFWQSIVGSSDPTDFEAYVEQFPNGVFRRLAENRLSALRSPAAGVASGGAARPAAAGRAPSGGSRVSGGAGVAAAAGPAVGAAADPGLRPGDVFRDCAACPEMVVLPGGGLALGRYEVTVGEYRAFVSATGAGAGGGCSTRAGGDSWRSPGFPQTDRHPAVCVSWDDAGP